MNDDNNEDSLPPAPPGWKLMTLNKNFSWHALNCYFRVDGVAPGVGFYSRRHHANLNSVVHGGALMTLADVALFAIAGRGEENFHGVTVTMNTEFLSAAPLGAFITATGDVTRRGRSLVFVRGMVSAEDKDVLAFSGTLKRIKLPA